MDTVDEKTRSKIMSRVRSKDTGPELLVRKALHKQGFRYRLHPKNLPGHPDMVFPRYRAVIFVHGCFWHRHGCHLSTSPKTHQDFWKEKFEANVKRDRRIQEELRSSGWRILTIWECALEGKMKLPTEELLEKVCCWLKGDSPVQRIP